MRDIHQPLLGLLRQELAAAGMQATIIEGGVGGEAGGGCEGGSVMAMRLMHRLR